MKKILDVIATIIRITVLAVVVIVLLSCLTFLLSIIYLTLLLTETLGALIFNRSLANILCCCLSAFLAKFILKLQTSRLVFLSEFPAKISFQTLSPFSS